MANLGDIGKSPASYVSEVITTTYELAGTLLDENSDPLRGHIYIMDLDSPRIVTIKVTATDGTWSAPELLSPGLYAVVAQDLGKTLNIIGYANLTAV